MSDAGRVRRAVTDGSAGLIELASDLIRLDTTTRGEPDEPARDEEELQRLLAARLAAAGAEVELWEPAAGVLDRWPRQVPPGLGFAGRPQLVARFPVLDESAPSLLFNGHIDVVSAEPRSRWRTDPFEPEIRGGRLHGRGACDMKGGIAAMVIAAEALAAEDALPPGGLVVSTVTDEEWNGAGTLASVVHGVRADAGVIPEATGFEAWIACRGIANPTVTVRGRPGHAEMPQPGWRDGGAVNAIEKAALVLEAVADLRDRWRREGPGHPLLAPGDLVPTVISGGEWWVSYPASCEIVLDVTYLPCQGDPDGGGSGRLESEIEDWLRTASRRDSWLAEHPPELTWGTNLAPAEIPPGHPIVASALEAGATVGVPGRVAAEQGWHDAATLTRFGTPTISYGPSVIANGETMAHAINESVPVADLVRTAEAYALVGLDWPERAR